MAKLSAYGGQVVKRYHDPRPDRKSKLAVVELPSGKLRLLRNFEGFGWKVLGQSTSVKGVTAHIAVRFPDFIES